MVINDKSIATIQEWELDPESSTRWDAYLAVPSQEELYKGWIAWSTLAYFSGILTLGVFFGVVSSQKVRQQPFNLYLIYLMIPDIGFSLLCATTCALNATKGSYWSHAMCNFQQFYLIWGVGSNCWLNSVITYELHKLLACSQIRKRYRLPTRRTITLQACGVYMYCAFLGSWGLIQNDNFPHRTLPLKGTICLPIEADRSSALFYWLVMLPLFIGIPMVYLSYVVWDIWRRQLLPPNGKRRLLSLYFGRVILVFFALWLPYFLAYSLAPYLPHWALVILGSFSHLQGPASAIVSMRKPDIWQAVKRFWTCRQCGGEEGESVHLPPRSLHFDARRRSSLLRGPFFGRGSAAAAGRVDTPITDEIAATHPTTVNEDENDDDHASCHLWPNSDGEYHPGTEDHPSEEDDEDEEMGEQTKPEEAVPAQEDPTGECLDMAPEDPTEECMDEEEDRDG